MHWGSKPGVSDCVLVSDPKPVKYALVGETGTVVRQPCVKIYDALSQIYIYIQVCTDQTVV